MPRPTTTKHLAILECDQPLDRTRAKYGGYGGVFTALLQSGAAALGRPNLIVPASEAASKGKAAGEINGQNGTSEENGEQLRITTWNIEQDMNRYPDLDDIDAILITGSRHSAFGTDPWIHQLVDYTRKALAHPTTQIIGVCFGHQICGRALGVKVARSDIGWETSVCNVQLSDPGREIFDGRDELKLHQMHRDVVTTLPVLPSSSSSTSAAAEPPPNVVLLGSSPRCAIQGMSIPRKLLTVQGHPEFDAEIVRELLEVRHRAGIFSDEVYEEALRRVGDVQDGVVVGKAFLRFLGF